MIKDGIWVLGYPQHDQSLFLFINAGLCFSKPNVILLLEEGKEPWSVKRELAKGLCSGGWGRNRQAKTLTGNSSAWLKGVASSLFFVGIFSNVLDLSITWGLLGYSPKFVIWNSLSFNTFLPLSTDSCIYSLSPISSQFHKLLPVF